MTALKERIRLEQRVMTSQEKLIILKMMERLNRAEKEIIFCKRQALTPK